MASMSSRVRRFLLLAVLPAALAAGCGGGSKTIDTTTTKQKTAPSAQGGKYHVGEHCQQSLAFAYSAQGLQCVNGKLRQKANNKSPKTVHHHGHTTTAAPQGY
jgi:hypothetical protein